MKDSWQKEKVKMEKRETINFMQRIRSYYQEFTMDDFKIEEWHSQLKDYDAKDVNERLDKHLKSETYGDYPPKLNYILAGIIKTKDKDAVRKYIIVCENCGRELDYFNYDAHIRKCNAIDYVIREMKKYLNKVVTREQLENMSDANFWDKYDAMLQIIKDKLPDKSGKKKLIQAYFGEIDLSIDDTQQAMIDGYNEEVNENE